MENLPTGQDRVEVKTGGTQHRPVSTRSKRPLGKRNLIAAVIVVLLLLGIAAAAMGVYRTSLTAQIDKNGYQAVFLNNGQVYFGKLKNQNGDYVRLTSVFYLQAKTQETGTAGNPQETSPNGTDVQLIKLGNEVHGPKDEMIISKDQILFLENLKSDGKVAQSINQYLNK